MADKIVSWGGIDSKGTSGLSITGSTSFYSTQDNGFVAIASGSRSSSDIAFNFQKIGEPSVGSRHTMLVQGTGGQDTNLYFGVNQVGSSPGATFAIKGNGSVNINMPNPTGNYAGLAVGGWISSYPSLLVRGYGTTSSTTALLVQNSNASASFTVRDDGLVQLPGGGKLDFNNNSTQCWITTAGGGTGLSSRSLNLPGTGGPSHWAFYNTSAYGIQLIDTSGDSLTLSPGQSSSNFAIMSLLKSVASNRGGGGFIWRDNTSGNRTFSFGNSASEFGDETGVHTKIQAGAGGTVGGGSYGDGGHIYLEGGAAAYSTNRPGNILISTNITGSKVGIGISIPTASLHISGASSNVLLEIDSPAVNNILYVSGSGNVGIGTSNPTVALEVSGSIISKAGMLSTGSISHRGSFKLQGEPIAYGSLPYTGSWQDMIVFTPGANLGGGSYLYPQFYVTWGSSTTTISGGTLSTSSPASNVNALSLTAGGRSFSFYPYEQYISSTRNLNLLPASSYNVGINTQSPTAKLHIVGQGATSSTTTLLVQNANATSSLQIYDDNNITIGLGTTTFTSLGGNGNAPSSSIYFDNYPNSHQVHHQIITRAAGQGNSYNYLRFPAAYDGVYQFIGAGVGVTLALTNSGSTAFMNYNHNGITTNASNAPITIDPSARTLTYGGGLNDVNHLAPYLVILKGNRPLSSGLDAGGDVYILGGLPRSGSSGASGSIYLLGSTINISGSVVITGSLTVSGSNITSAWTAYTPTWTAASSNPAIGNGTIEGYYKVVGKTCFVRGNIAMGSTTTFGSGEWYVSMPFTASHADAILMTATLLDNGSAWYNATLVGARAGFNYKAPIQYQAVGGTANDVNSTQPFTWTNTDRFIWNGSYEIA